MVSAKEAARLTGMSKPGILKAIKSGRISASKDAAGQWVIDPVELFRVYAPVGTRPSATPQPDQDVATVEARLLRDQLQDRDATIADLRARLDAAEEERRRLQLILTDSQRRPWWARILGR